MRSRYKGDVIAHLSAPTKPATNDGIVLALRNRVRDAAFRMMPAGRFLRRGPSGVRRVALTFDDGPDHRTEEYLDLLDRYGAAATFFVMGDNSELRPDLVREMVRRGHQVASHGYDHNKFTELSRSALAAQLRATETVIGPQPAGRWVRPPHGAINLRVVGQLFARGYTIAMWSFDSQDYMAKDPEAVVARCVPEAIGPGEVMLFHEGMGSTLAALPRVIEGLHRAGYECVTMADLYAT